MDLVEQLHLVADRVDRRRWILGKDGSFSLKFSYGFLEVREEADFKWEGICRIKVPSKVLFIIWTGLKGRIPTLDILQTWGLILPNMCPLCLGDAESVAHTLLHSPFVWEVWSAILYKANVMWVVPVRCLSFCQQWFPPCNRCKVRCSGVCLCRLFGGRFGLKEIA